MPSGATTQTKGVRNGRLMLGARTRSLVRPTLWCTCWRRMRSEQEVEWVPGAGPSDITWGLVERLRSIRDDLWRNQYAESMGAL